MRDLFCANTGIYCIGAGAGFLFNDTVLLCIIIMIICKIYLSNIISNKYVFLNVPPISSAVIFNIHTEVNCETLDTRKPFSILPIDYNGPEDLSTKKTIGNNNSAVCCVGYVREINFHSCCS